MAGVWRRALLQNEVRYATVRVTSDVLTAMCISRKTFESTVGSLTHTLEKQDYGPKGAVAKKGRANSKEEAPAAESPDRAAPRGRRRSVVVKPPGAP